MGTLDQRASNVVVIHGDDSQRDQKVNKEDHHRVDLRMHLIGHWVWHAVHKGDIHVVPVTLGRQKTKREKDEENK